MVLIWEWRQELGLEEGRVHWVCDSLAPQVWAATSSRESTVPIQGPHDGALYICHCWSQLLSMHLKGPKMVSSGYHCPGYVLNWVLQALSLQQGLSRPREITKILLALKLVPVCILITQEILSSAICWWKVSYLKYWPDSLSFCFRFECLFK